MSKQWAPSCKWNQNIGRRPRVYMKHCLCYLLTLLLLVCHIILQQQMVAPPLEIGQHGEHEGLPSANPTPPLQHGDPRGTSNEHISSHFPTELDRVVHHANQKKLAFRAQSVQKGPVLQGFEANQDSRDEDVKVKDTSYRAANMSQKETAWPVPQSHFQRYAFNCTNVNQITIKRKLGHGVTKQVYLGLYEGKKIAVKMVTRNQIDVQSCMKRMKRDGYDTEQEKHKCFAFPNMKLMKEILLLEQIQHPNLLKMLGYCVRSEETESTSLQEHGIIAVYEYGLRFYLSTIRNWPWKVRLKTALELTDLLDYFQHSPLGSLRISDFKDAHFLLKDGKIKLTDLDDVTSLEHSCDTLPHEPININKGDSGPRTCSFELKCIGGICPGHNAKQNMKNMNELFFKNLLHEAPNNTVISIAGLRHKLDNLSLTARELKHILYRLMDIPHIPGYS